MKKQTYIYSSILILGFLLLVSPTQSREFSAILSNSPSSISEITPGKYWSANVALPYNFAIYGPLPVNFSNPDGYHNFYYKMSGILTNAPIYSVVYIYPYSGSDDYDLYLYSNPDFALDHLMASSNATDSAPEWIVVKIPQSSVAIYYYPKVYSGSQGEHAAIWSDTSPVLNGDFPSRSFEFDSNNLTLINVFYSELESTKNYTFTLNVPENSDYDLYIYYIATSNNACNKSDYLEISATRALDTDEVIQLVNPINGRYCILLYRFAGDEAASISYSEVGGNNSIPAFSWPLLVISLIPTILLYSRKFNQSRKCTSKVLNSSFF
jgi:hypothetical protein